MQQINYTIDSQRKLTDEVYEICLAGDTSAITTPGQFVNLRLEGFYLHSERGNELFAFPNGATLAPGATLTVGTYSTEGGCDLLWEDKKVVHKKKTDMFRLYDPWGRVVDAMDNGL